MNPVQSNVHQRERVPSVRWPVDIDMAFSERSGEFIDGWVRVDCPSCGRTGSPLLSRLTRRLRSYRSWVGLSYTAPHADYETRCPGCRATYRFTTYAPQ
jgi:hypothetical protein